MMEKENISRDEIAEAMKSEFGFNRKLCLDIVNDIIDIIILGLETDKIVRGGLDILIKKILKNYKN